MEQNLIVIYIGIWKFLGIIGTVIAATASGAWYAASRLAKVETKVEGFDNRLTSLEGRLDSAFASSSPIALLPKGETILQESGLKAYLDEKKSELAVECEKIGKMDNPYDIQESAFKFFDQYDFGDFERKLKESAFNYGVSMELVRRIAGIYFRDLCLENRGFTPQDLDKPIAS